MIDRVTVQPLQSELVKTIAVIGAGISGLAAAYFLSRKYQVHVFERDTRIGGHTNTVHVETPEGRRALDTGFLVYNEHTYPKLTRLFAELGVETHQGRAHERLDRVGQREAK